MEWWAVLPGEGVCQGVANGHGQIEAHTLGMRKLPATAAEDLLELIMRRYERRSILITSNRPVGPAPI